MTTLLYIKAALDVLSISALVAVLASWRAKK